MNIFKINKNKKDKEEENERIKQMETDLKVAELKEKYKGKIIPCDEFVDINAELPSLFDKFLYKEFYGELNPHSFIIYKINEVIHKINKNIKVIEEKEDFKEIFLKIDEIIKEVNNDGESDE